MRTGLIELASALVLVSTMAAAGCSEGGSGTTGTAGSGGGTAGTVLNSLRSLMLSAQAGNLIRKKKDALPRVLLGDISVRAPLAHGIVHTL